MTIPIVCIVVGANLADEVKAPSTALSLKTAAAQAGEAPQAILSTWESPSPSQVEKTFTVSPFGVEHQVRLSLEARIAWRTLSGSNPWLRVAVNGHYLTWVDLLNKRDAFRVRGGVDLTWSKGDRWRVLYSPDFESAVRDKNNPSACPDADPYKFVWDISRYVQPGENRLRLENLKILEQPTTMIVRNVDVVMGRPISPPPEVEEQAPGGPDRLFVARPPAAVPIDARLDPSGAIVLTLGGIRLTLTTRVSQPGGGWHETAPPDPAAQADSLKSAGLRTGVPAEARWTSAALRVTRRVTRCDDHLQVSDLLENRGTELLGVIIKHRLQGPRKPDEVRLAGHLAVGEVAMAANAEQPSVFARWGEAGVGLVTEDDVFRIHVRQFAGPEGVGLADERLGIPPGKQVTLEWGIYPAPAADYWDFINAVRRNWGVNFTIPGPFAFTMHFRGEHPASWYGQWARRRDLKIVAGGIATFTDGRYAHGTGILFAPEWVAYESDWMRKMLSAAPEIKALCYFHAQISTEPDGERKYADCKLLDAGGHHLGYPYRYRLPQYLPTRENSYGKALWGYVHTCLDKIGASGLYWDEMSHSAVAYAYDAPWDGCTVLIDPKTHAVQRKLSSVALLMQPLELDIIDYLRRHGKFLLANTQATTRTMTHQRVLRFVETGSYSAVLGTHLGCPLGLGNHHPEKTQADSAKQVREILRRGGIYYGHGFDRSPPGWNFAQFMYPITPVELHEGVVLGQERILAARPGSFGWPDGAAADVYVADGQGGRVDRPDVKEVQREGRRCYQVRMPPSHFAVLVRREGI
jgi:hypothetical protein